MSVFIYFFVYLILFFFFNDTATTEIYTLSLHDALPISFTYIDPARFRRPTIQRFWEVPDEIVENVIVTNYRSEEHTSELQSQSNLVCRLLLEKKKNILSKQINSKNNNQKNTIRNITTLL